MEYYVLFCILILWTMFWSFSSVIITRIKSWKRWILNWRSECPKCEHKLDSKDLIPVISYLRTWGKCRYCKAKISHLYPILEICMWIIFALTAYVMVNFTLLLSWDLIEIYKLIFFLFLIFLTMIFVVYDILYLEIPDSIMIIAITSVFWVLTFQTLTNEVLLYTIPQSLLGLNSIINYSAIWLALLIIWWLYLIMLAWLSELIDLTILTSIIWSIYAFSIYFNIDPTLIPILNWVIWAIAIFTFFFAQILVSKWRWMWWWDLRIALLIWLVLWVSYSFAWIMVAYFIWSIIWLIFIWYKKLEAKHLSKKDILNRIKAKIWFKIKTPNINTEIPFWPFLAIGLFLVLFYGDIIIQSFKDYLW